MKRNNIESPETDYKMALDAFAPYWEEVQREYLIRLFKDDHDLRSGICCYAEAFEGTIREVVKRGLDLYFRFSSNGEEPKCRWTIVPNS